MTFYVAKFHQNLSDIKDYLLRESVKHRPLYDVNMQDCTFLLVIHCNLYPDASQGNEFTANKTRYLVLYGNRKHPKQDHKTSSVICMSSAKEKKGPDKSMPAVMHFVNPRFMRISLTEVASGPTSAGDSDVGETSPPTPISPLQMQQRYRIGGCCCLKRYEWRDEDQ